jgi:hypothetical protein
MFYFPMLNTKDLRAKLNDEKEKNCSAKFFFENKPESMTVL